MNANRNVFAVSACRDALRTVTISVFVSGRAAPNKSRGEGFDVCPSSAQAHVAAAHTSIATAVRLRAALAESWLNTSLD
jgi:hypothetical protein